MVCREGKIAMPYVQIPKDLTQVKSKVMFNLTKRQLICFSAAAATGVPFYLLTRGVIGTTIAALGMLFLMVPWVAVAMYERDGQPLEKIARNYIMTRFVRKRVRPYQTENFYTYLQKQVDSKKEDTAIATSNATRRKKGQAAANASRPGKNK